MIVVVDYGMGNVGSIANMLKKVGAAGVVSADPDVIKKADKLVLPGVGAFDSGMRNLAERGLKDLLDEKVLGQRTPILGICLGIQLFTRRSEEGSLPGLGWVDADTVRFKFNGSMGNLKIPHMGWNTVELKRQHPVFAGMYDEPRFYFVHSYHVKCANDDDVLTTTVHGFEFTSGVARGNITGVQFHPEKSHKFGMRLLKSFSDYA